MHHELNRINPREPKDVEKIQNKNYVIQDQRRSLFFPMGVLAVIILIAVVIGWLLASNSHQPAIAQQVSTRTSSPQPTVTPQPTQTDYLGKLVVIVATLMAPTPTKTPSPSPTVTVDPLAGLKYCSDVGAGTPCVPYIPPQAIMPTPWPTCAPGDYVENTLNIDPCLREDVPYFPIASPVASPVVATPVASPYTCNWEGFKRGVWCYGD